MEHSSSEEAVVENGWWGVEKEEEEGEGERERGKNETNGEKFHYIFQHVKIKIF